MEKDTMIRPDVVNGRVITMDVTESEAKEIIKKVMRDIGLKEEQINLAFEDSPEGRSYMKELNKHYRLDIDTILRERKRTHEKSMRDYYNDMAVAREKGLAEGFEEGRAEVRAAVAERMRKNGFTEEQIKLVLGENYNG